MVGPEPSVSSASKRRSASEAPLGSVVRPKEAIVWRNLTWRGLEETPDAPTHLEKYLVA